MAALAAPFGHPVAQLKIMDKVKHALQRATVLPENQEKHKRIGEHSWPLTSTSYCDRWKRRLCLDSTGAGTFHALRASGHSFVLEGPGSVLFELNAGGLVQSARNCRMDQPGSDNFLLH
ncbi:hypothetical protein RvY_05272 [Ramazzottius varieornatus]|uniref:Uncharacterized protein n=1 Tax=Ramazzottius varieornatus TaxID=947166 RepID=A0A1D1UXK5_RAMVA|nr:hypothetical protein RvY_05272 [Ramazzottius varieornatus]